jgi:hypothetical protein
MSRRKLRLVVVAFVFAVMLTLALTSVASAEPSSGGYWYQVVPGDTWYGLVRKTGVSYYTLWNANPAHHHWNNWLYVGDWLWIPYSPGPSGYWYQVQPGDTWYGLARRTGLSWWTLWNANPAHHHWNKWLYVGDWLWIPN